MLQVKQALGLLSIGLLVASWTNCHGFHDTEHAPGLILNWSLAYHKCNDVRLNLLLIMLSGRSPGPWSMPFQGQGWRVTLYITIILTRWERMRV